MNEITLKTGMEIDLGGIGKEYAVDRTLMLIAAYVDKAQLKDVGFLVNFGGDVACAGTRKDHALWSIGVESHLSHSAAAQVVSLRHGGIATSGDTRRFLLKDGVRYGHILDPRTGWSVKNAPHSITVIAQTCTIAGMMATFAMLEGAQAEAFLAEQKGIRYWVQR
jgi:thiamine biosynthesis lipoprotein